MESQGIDKAISGSKHIRPRLQPRHLSKRLGYAITFIFVDVLGLLAKLMER
jgi:hypothetical protein